MATDPLLTYLVPKITSSSHPAPANQPPRPPPSPPPAGDGPMRSTSGSADVDPGPPSHARQRRLVVALQLLDARRYLPAVPAAPLPRRRRRSTPNPRLARRALRR